MTKNALETVISTMKLQNLEKCVKLLDSLENRSFKYKFLSIFWSTRALGSIEGAELW